MVHSLAGKIALVIGGGSGIGLGCARALASRDARVVVAGRRAGALASAAQSYSPPFMHHTVDVTDRESVDGLFRWMNKEIGSVDILVNSAGTNITKRSMASMTPEEWDDVLAVNATGFYNCLYGVLPQMRQRASGLVINISSIAGKRAVEVGGIAYNASKFAATALATTVGLEESPHGIRITSIFPGEVNTPMIRKRPVPPDEQQQAAMLQPGDVGEVVAMLACLPPHVHIPELIIKPLHQPYA
jgi:NADP-dependent 3-hydroxy acid dehydrogenase YdfG